MHKKILVTDLIVEGARLFEALKRNHFPLVAAFWSYFAESVEWRLVIASPLMNHMSPLEVYTRVQRILNSINLSHLTVSDIALISNESQDYRNWREAFPSPVPYTASTAASYPRMIFEDTYIYYVQR
jgi:hypothetical protein